MLLQLFCTSLGSKNYFQFPIYKELAWNARLQPESECSLEQTETSHNSTGTLQNLTPIRELLQVTQTVSNSNLKIYRIIEYLCRIGYGSESIRITVKVI